MTLTGNATAADVRGRLLDLLAAHGIPNEAVKERALNRAANSIMNASHEAFIAGENHVTDRHPRQDTTTRPHTLAIEGFASAVREYVARIGLTSRVVPRDSFDATPGDDGSVYVTWTQYTPPGVDEPAAPDGTWDVTGWEASLGEPPQTRYRMVTDIVPPFPIRAGQPYMGEIMIQWGERGYPAKLRRCDTCGAVLPELDSEVTDGD